VKPNFALLSNNEGYAKRHAEAWYYKIAAALTPLAKSWGHHPLGLTIAWVASYPGTTRSIVGARKTDQLTISFAAKDITLLTEQHDQLSALSRTPPDAKDRLEDQR